MESFKRFLFGGSILKTSDSDGETEFTGEVVDSEAHNAAKIKLEEESSEPTSVTPETIAYNPVLANSSHGLIDESYRIVNARRLKKRIYEAIPLLEQFTQEQIFQGLKMKYIDHRFLFTLEIQLYYYVQETYQDPSKKFGVVKFPLMSLDDIITLINKIARARMQFIEFNLPH